MRLAQAARGTLSPRTSVYHTIKTHQEYGTTGFQELRNRMMHIVPGVASTLWIDENCGLSIYTECLMRTMTFDVLRIVMTHGSIAKPHS